LSPISNPALIPPGGWDANSPTRPTAPAGGPGGVKSPDGGARETPVDATSGQSFAEALKQAGGAEPLQFSRHALARVQRRGIELDSATLGRLSEGVGRAASKGSRDSLVLVDGTAFVVSVSNRTVITAVGSEHMKDNVFTNIDSAVIA
jgi:flagellar operon protein